MPETADFSDVWAEERDGYGSDALPRLEKAFRRMEALLQDLKDKQADVDMVMLLEENERLETEMDRLTAQNRELREKLDKVSADYQRLKDVSRQASEKLGGAIKTIQALAEA